VWKKYLTLLVLLVLSFSQVFCQSKSTIELTIEEAQEIQTLLTEQQNMINELQNLNKELTEQSQNYNKKYQTFKKWMIPTAISSFAIGTVVGLMIYYKIN
jgi:uncharacterized protein YlxW (UPF0749 family)